MYTVLGNKYVFRPNFGPFDVDFLSLVYHGIQRYQPAFSVPAPG